MANQACGGDQEGQLRKAFTCAHFLYLTLAGHDARRAIASRNTRKKGQRKESSHTIHASVFRKNTICQLLRSLASCKIYFNINRKNEHSKKKENPSMNDKCDKVREREKDLANTRNMGHREKVKRERMSKDERKLLNRKKRN